MVDIIDYKTMLWPLIVSAVLACDVTFYAQSEATNIWESLASLYPTQSPYVVCLAGSEVSAAFTLADTAQGCLWGSSDLIIQ